MTEPDPRLLVDLARLASKYKPKDWQALAAWLEDDHREKLRALLHELTVASAEGRPKRTARPRRRTQAPPRAPKVRETISELRLNDVHRADLLDEIWLKLRERELLPTIADVRAFAEAVGRKHLEATRRDQAVTELMEHLVGMAPDALEERMRDTLSSNRQLGEEYEQWVRFILRGTTQATPP
jgi:hypothetical protein